VRELIIINEEININKKEVSNINYIEDKIGYSFTDRSLLLNALTHSTYSYESKEKYCVNNERLEFLGDSVLDLIVGDILFKDSDLLPEGVMSKIRALIVCETTLSEVSKTIGLGDYLLLGKGEELTDGRNKISNLSNAVEAIIAAIYLDGGYEKAYKVVEKLVGRYIKMAKTGKIVYDHKSKFIEYVQSIKEQGNIRFCIIKEEGPEHNRTFYAQIIYNETILGTGCGSTKKEAEQEAAKEAYEKMTSNDIRILGKDPKV